MYRSERPGVEIDAIDRIYQVKNYAWNQSLTVGVLTNFRQLRVFATSSPPDLAKPWEGDLEGLHLSFDKFADSFDEIWNVLSYDAARRGDSPRQHSPLWVRPSVKGSTRPFSRTLNDGDC